MQFSACSCQINSQYSQSLGIVPYFGAIQHVRWVTIADGAVHVWAPDIVSLRAIEASGGHLWGDSLRANSNVPKVHFMHANALAKKCRGIHCYRVSVE